MVYLKSVENVITLGKLIGLLFLFCLPLLSILCLKTKRNDLARPVMGTIFLVTITLHSALLHHLFSLSVAFAFCSLTTNLQSSVIIKQRRVLNC